VEVKKKKTELNKKTKEDRENKVKKNRAFTDKLIEKGKIQRKVTLKRMLADRKTEKDEMMKSKGEYEEEIKTTRDNDTKLRLLSKVRFIEDEL